MPRCRPAGPVDRMRRGAAEALVDVDRRVGVAGRDRLARVEEHPLSVQRHGRERGIEGAVAPRRTGGHEVVVPPAYSYTSRHWGPCPAAQPVSVSAATSDSSVRT